MYVYHIDRKNILHLGDELKLSPLQDYFSITDSNDQYLSPFTSGLSTHGIKYFAENFKSILSSDDLNSYDIELFFEFIRQLHFPNKLSRFQSIFTVQEIAQLEKWGQLKVGNYQIVKLKVEHNNYSTHDASFLNRSTLVNKNNPGYFKFSPGSYLDNAFNYWNGSMSSDPKVELLIKPPVKVVEIL